MFPGGIHAYNVMGQERATFLTMLVYSYDVRAKMLASFLASLIRAVPIRGSRRHPSTPSTGILTQNPRYPALMHIRPMLIEAKTFLMLEDVRRFPSQLDPSRSWSSIAD